MKKIILTLFLFSSISNSKDLTDNIIEYFDSQISSTIELSHENALIKSYSDLEFYSNLQDEKFPLNLLSDTDRKIFVDSLKFNKKGLTTYNYSVLEKLEKNDIYKILSLFGFENNVDLITNPKLESKCVLMMKCDHTGYECSSRATCKQADYSICTSNC